MRECGRTGSGRSEGYEEKRIRKGEVREVEKGEVKKVGKVKQEK